MVTREGMEAALLLIQVRGNQGMFRGSVAGLAAADLMSWGWAHYGHRITIKRFFQVTGLFLLLFTIQIAFYSIPELSEAAVLGRWSGAIHNATEPYSPVGYYGKWVSIGMLGLCALWLAAVALNGRCDARSFT